MYQFLYTVTFVSGVYEGSLRNSVYVFTGEKASPKMNGVSPGKPSHTRFFPSMSRSVDSDRDSVSSWATACDSCDDLNESRDSGLFTETPSPSPTDNKSKFRMLSGTVEVLVKPPV